MSFGVSSTASSVAAASAANFSFRVEASAPSPTMRAIDTKRAPFSVKARLNRCQQPHVRKCL